MTDGPSLESEPALPAGSLGGEAAYAWLSRDTKVALRQLLQLTKSACQAAACAVLVIDGGLELTVATHGVADYVVPKGEGLHAQLADARRLTAFSNEQLCRAGVQLPFQPGLPAWTWMVQPLECWARRPALIWVARAADKPFDDEERGIIERCAALVERELTLLGRNKDIVVQRERATVEIAQLHEQLYRQHLLYRELAKHLPGTAVLVFDVDLHVRIREGWHALEWPAASVDKAGAHVAEYFTKEEMAHTSGACSEAIKGRRTTFEIRVAGRSYELSAGPLPDASGSIIFGILVVRDVTEDRMQRAQSTATTARLQALVERLEDGILVEDEHQQVQLCSNRLRSLLQFDPAERGAIPQDGRALMTLMASVCFIPEAFEESTMRLVESRTANRNELIYLADMRVLERDYVPLAAEGQDMGHLWVYRDVTQREQSKDLLQQQADHLRALSLVDELTGLYNRRGFLTLATQQLKLCDRTMRPALVVFIDLDGMKRINDELGHEFGDQALVEAANILRNCMRNSDVIARLGGDEFVALALDATCDTSEGIELRLYEGLEKANSKPGRAFALGFSIGIAPYDPASAEMIEEVLARADTLMYEQKRARKAART